jgi:PPK2 family polyphosphate:nucleotide phosphotransferase
MSIADHYRIFPGDAPRLSSIDPAYHAEHKNKSSAKDEIRTYAARLRELQYMLYAENRHGLLICLQAMNTGGKDGTIRHVLGYMNPQGCRVKSFKQPTTEEAAHDFLWRIHKETPSRGEVVIFNRSHYEDVLVVRVHNMVSPSQCLTRYEAINSFEKYLADYGVHILKFFLHISKEEQLKRLRKRLSDPHRHWKISEADYSERSYWDDYQRAYEDTIHHCSTEWAPWFVIPANHKWFRNLTISRIVIEYMEQLDMHFPETKVDLDMLRSKFQQ